MDNNKLTKKFDNKYSQQNKKLQKSAKLLHKNCRQQWLEQNKEAIEAYNKAISVRGVFSDNMRCF